MVPYGKSDGEIIVFCDATDDRKKKLRLNSLIPSSHHSNQCKLSGRLRTSFLHLIFGFMTMLLVTAMYDATMLVWREKVVFNAVRPTTVVHALKGEEEIETY